MQFTNVEIQDLLRSWFLVSLAFSIATVGMPWQPGFVIAVGFVSLTAGIGFVLHELAHKWVAQRYGCKAQYKAFDKLLWLAVFISFFGFVFAAPGAVFIGGRKITASENGKISLAGPAMNFFLAIVFIALGYLMPPLFTPIAYFGKSINAWLGLFNMLPFMPFDGSKIYIWNKIVYTIFVIIGISLVFIKNA
ncbi:MAG: site-2 protease family protein [Nanoarchaeota archaeon]